MQHGIGLQSSIWNNNLKSIILLMAFPCLIAGLLWAIIFVNFFQGSALELINWQNAAVDASFTVKKYGTTILVGVVIWFAIAWSSHQDIINYGTNAKPLLRTENPDLYNLLENLCISRGFTMPKLFVIDSPVLNAYASGINQKTYAITLTSGLIQTLEKDELEAVLAHELTHIINRDVRLLVISIIFVGIIGFVCQILFRIALYKINPHYYNPLGVSISNQGNSSENSDKNKSTTSAAFIIIALIAISALGYLFTILIRFALSRRREYMADAGAVELTKNSAALISALNKISGNSHLAGVNSDVQQMMFDNQHSFLGVFSTHPPIETRIKILENY